MSELLSFEHYHHDMNRAVIKDLKTKLHDFNKRQNYMNNELREQAEKQFRIFVNIGEK